MDFLRNLFGKKPPVTKSSSSESSQPVERSTPKLPVSHFNSLAGPADDHLMKWKAHVVECSLNYPMPSMQAVTAIARGTQRMPDTLLNNIRELDEQLGLKGSLFSVFIDLEGSIHHFKGSPDGVGFQNLGRKFEEASALMEKLKNERTAAD